MDARENRKNNWEDLDITKEELNNLNECLKNKEFRNLLIEYADEINNPENRKLYQSEITKLEKERGIDVKFVNPEPGYVIKTSCNGDKKCFVNISKSDNVGKPTSQPSKDDEKIRGLKWSLPYSLSPPRDDFDKKNHLCTVFDVVFHPDTLYLASKDPRFRKIVNETALDGVENNFKVKLDRNNLKFPRINFKGLCQSTVIRKKSDKPVEKTNVDVEPEIYQKLMSSYDQAREKNLKTINNDKPTRPTPPTKLLKNNQKNNNDEFNKNSTHTVPKFIIKHQTDMDIQDFKNTKDSKMLATVPKKLVVIIDLPLLKSADDAVLDVQDNYLTLTSEKPAKYSLELPLPYCVDPDQGNAKFDTTSKKLTITLPVLRNIKLSEVKDDSGVESDHGSPSNNSLEDDDDDNNKNDMIMFESSDCLISEATENVKSNNDTALSTNTNSEEDILNNDVIYSLPLFTPNIFDNTLALTIHVKNADPASIRSKFLANYSGIQLTFSSVGAGFFPVFYALCFKLKDYSFEHDTLVIEPWDNNVVFTVKINNVDDLKYYYFGINDDLLEKKDLPHVVCFEDKIESLKSDESLDNEDKEIKVMRNDNEVVVMIRPKDMESEDDNKREIFDNNKKIKLKKSRSVSESSGDELGSNHGSENGSVPRGILKTRRNFSRSVSESSIDDTTGLASSVDIHYDSVQELNSESDCCSLKKTVRFNDVVSRQLFRSNSSILGRRKKNQRKLRKKKQAHERRMSESECSETDERDKYKIDSKTNVDDNDDNDDDDNEKGIENVKPILNRDKTSARVQSTDNNNHETDKSNNDPGNNLALPEFKNDLIFDLDM